jgi:hypothetical protein
MEIALAAVVASIALTTPEIAAACIEGQLRSCTLAGGCTGRQECGYNIWGPCEPLGCNDGNPLTYGDKHAHSPARQLLPW